MAFPKLNKSFFSLLASYMMASWGIVQFVEWLSNRYGFHDGWTDIVGLAVIIFLPSVLLFSWLQSADKNRFKNQKLLYSTNIIVALLAFSFLYQIAFANTTQNVTVKDEFGKEQTLEVSKREYIRQIVFLPFQNKGSQDWLSMALPALLAMDIQQCKRFNITSPQNFVDKLIKLEYKLKDPIPQNIKTKFLKEWFGDYIVSGTVYQIDSSHYDYSLQVYSAQLSDVLFASEGKSNNIYTLVDSLSQVISSEIFSKDLKIKKDSYKDIPAKEIFSDNLTALQAYFNSFLANRHYDRTTAYTQINKAISLDPKFAAAFQSRGLIQFYNNKITEAKSDFQKAMQFSNSSTEYIQFKIKNSFYTFATDGARNKLENFLKMWCQIHPEDSYPFGQLMNLYQQNRNLDKAIDIGLQAETAGHQSFFLMKMAKLYASKKEEAKVEEYLATYQKTFPDETGSHLEIGKIYLDQYDYQKAGKHFEEYQTLNPLELQANLKLSKCYFQLGRFDEAKSQIDEAISLTKTLEDSFHIFVALENYYQDRGQIKKAIELMNQRATFSEHKYAPLQLIFSRIQLDVLYKYIVIQDYATAENRIRAAEAALDPAQKIYTETYWLNYYFLREEVKEFDKKYEANKAFLIKNMPKEMFDALEGYSYKFKGNYPDAIKVLEKVVASTSDRMAKYHLYDAYRLNKEYKKAIDGYEVFEKEQPYEGTLLIEYAKVLNDAGEVEKAKEILERLQKLWKKADPEYVGYQELLSLSKQLNLAI